MLEVTDEPVTRFAQEAERRRIARELHDGAVQSLTALVTDLEQFRVRSTQNEEEMAARLLAWQQLARESLLSMRATLGGLRMQSEFDFNLALDALLAETRNKGYIVTFERSEWPATLPFAYASNLYAIIREALLNSCKHANASHLTIFLLSDEGRLYVSVGDNGSGMTASTLTNAPHSGYQLGLHGMQERTIALGGHMSIESSPARGTRIDIWVPIP